MTVTRQPQIYCLEVEQDGVTVTLCLWFGEMSGVHRIYCTLDARALSPVISCERCSGENRLSCDSDIEHFLPEMNLQAQEQVANACCHPRSRWQTCLLTKGLRHHVPPASVLCS